MKDRGAIHPLLLLCGSDGSPTDAIVHYARAMAGELCSQGENARVVIVDPSTGQRAMAAAIARVGVSIEGTLILQYNPFSFGHLGLAPGLVLGLARLRRRAPGLAIALMCHETVTLSPGLKWRGVRLLHRAQLVVLVRCARTLFVSTPAWSPEIRRLSGRTPIELPVGSNLPDRRARRPEVRRRLDVEDRLVVASFSTGHPAHRDDLLGQALAELAPRRPELMVLTLGAGRPPLPLGQTAGARELQFGFLPLEEVADLLAAADIFVSPYVDGASTRRGTLMAALQHGLPVVATVGSATDEVLRNHLGRYGIPPGDGAALATAVDHLAGDPEARARHGQAGRTLYAQRFDWPVTARRAAAALRA